MIGCKDAIVADAFATAFCNRVQRAEDIEPAQVHEGAGPGIETAGITARFYST